MSIGLAGMGLEALQQYGYSRDNRTISPHVTMHEFYAWFAFFGLAYFFYSFPFLYAAYFHVSDYFHISYYFGKSTPETSRCILEVPSSNRGPETGYPQAVQ
jgi:hypothetical protein